jgi:hypothetical protein
VKIQPQWVVTPEKKNYYYYYYYYYYTKHAYVDNQKTILQQLAQLSSYWSRDPTFQATEIYY